MEKISVLGQQIRNRDDHTRLVQMIYNEGYAKTDIGYAKSDNGMQIKQESVYVD